MNGLSNSRAAKPRPIVKALAALLLLAGSALASAATIDERQLLDAGFKVLVAATSVQEQWIKGLPAGKIRAMQRTGKKFFIYPDAPKKQVYVGGPIEYAAYVQNHPENAVTDAATAAREASAYRAKQTAAMQKATARDESDPYLGLSWADLGW